MLRMLSESLSNVSEVEVRANFEFEDLGLMLHCIQHCLGRSSPTFTKSYEPAELLHGNSFGRPLITKIACAKLTQCRLSRSAVTSCQLRNPLHKLLGIQPRDIWRTGSLSHTP